jgi:hypothetical protein
MWKGIVLIPLRADKYLAKACQAKVFHNISFQTVIEIFCNFLHILCTFSIINHVQCPRKISVFEKQGCHLVERLYGILLF